VDLFKIVSHYFDRQRGPDGEFKTADVRGKMLRERDGFRRNRKLATDFVPNIQPVLYVKVKSHENGPLSRFLHIDRRAN
jgi:hypothetical protein